MTTTTGCVKWFNNKAGYGFITVSDNDTPRDIFVHHSAIQGATIEELREGQIVEYEVGHGPKGPCAESVRVATQMV